MSQPSDLTLFATNLQEEVAARASMDGQEQTAVDAFTEMMIEYLVDFGELGGGQACFYRSKKRDIEVNGYFVSDDEDTLDLFTCLYRGVPPSGKIPTRELETGLKRALAFVRKAFAGFHKDLEPASPAYDMAARIHEIRKSLVEVRLFALTDGVTTTRSKMSDDWEGLKRTVHIWDLPRLYRAQTSGQEREPIEVNFEKNFGGALPCLADPTNSGDYRAFLAIINGDVLARIYEEYGPRLLELNVRSFLQARGAVNKGIRETIHSEPTRFLAYNNGISVTATDVRLVQLNGGGTGIAWVKDLQIVNGGQTTASLYHVRRKDKVDVSKVHVQAKFSIVKADQVDQIVPRISFCANSQNKINAADFSANRPFHVQLEKLSRTVWAPTGPNSSRQTRWYYERARGQYLDDKGRQATAASKREFGEIHPSNQKITKTDLAKFEHSWQQLPHKVSFGGEKNFREYMIRLDELEQVQRETYLPDQTWFQRMVAKAILFRRTEKIVQQEAFGGYRANIVAYSIAWLSWRTGKRIDLDTIWRQQDLTSPLKEAIKRVSRAIHTVLKNSPGGKNVTEWCKREACWEQARLIKVDLPGTLDLELAAHSFD
jgi:hypothetical protein